MGFIISKEFPSRFLKGEEIAGKEVNLVIREIRKEKVYNRKNRAEEVVMVIYFQDKERGIILKKERAMDIKGIHGDDTDGWIGKSVCLFTEKKKTGQGVFDVFRFKEATAPTTEEDKKALSAELDSIQ